MNNENFTLLRPVTQLANTGQTSAGIKKKLRPGFPINFKRCSASKEHLFT